MPDRRTFLTGLASLAAVGSLPVLAGPTFDAAGYVAELVAIGCQPYAFKSVSSGGVQGLWRHGIAAPEGRAFGRDLQDLMVRWFDRKEADPDYVEAVGEYIASLRK